MEENLMKQQKFLIAVVSVEEQDDTFESLIYVEYAFVKKQMLESWLEFENQVGRSFVKLRVIKSKNI